MMKVRAYVRFTKVICIYIRLSNQIQSRDDWQRRATTVSLSDVFSNGILFKTTSYITMMKYVRRCLVYIYIPPNAGNGRLFGGRLYGAFLEIRVLTAAGYLCQWNVASASVQNVK